MNTAILEGGTCQKPFDDHVELFLHHLRAAGYAERTLRKKRWAPRSCVFSAVLRSRGKRSISLRFCRDGERVRAPG